MANASAASTSVSALPSRISASSVPAAARAARLGLRPRRQRLGWRLGPQRPGWRRDIHISPRTTGNIQVADLLAQRVAVEAEHRRGLDLVAAGRRQGKADQRPLHLGDHPVVDIGRRHAAVVRGEEVADVPLDRARQRLRPGRRRRLRRLAVPLRPAPRRSAPRRWSRAGRAPRAGASGSPARAHCPARHSA